MSAIHVPDLSLVVLVGISGSGKSTFAARHFGPFETVSSDFCRGMVANDPNDQQATAAAFDLLTDIVSRRLRVGLLTVVDATSLRPEDRAALVRLARENDVLPCAIVLDVPLQTALERHRTRTDRPFDESVLRKQHAQLRKGLSRIGREKFRGVTVLDSDEAIADARIERTPLRSDLRDRTGPFDIIGDVHGCLPELEQLLTELGYRVSADGTGARHPEGRTAVFVGDLVDRGPDSAGVLRLVMGMHAAGDALCVPGNHEAKLVRALDGRNVTLSHGLEATMAQLQRGTEAFRREVRDFADSLVAHLVLDEGRLVVAHAGLKEEFHNRASGRVREFALYGDTTGETDEFGLPVRLDWAADYRGDAMVVYGHVPSPRAEWVNNTLCLDTGCVFGGQLSALRYPEKEIVAVPAQKEWYPPVRPLDSSATGEANRPLRIDDVLGADAVETSRGGRIRVAPERAAAALATMSRFAMPPELLPYLPPTMAPAPTSHEEGYLEHPRTAFGYYAKRGLRVICEEKHMGSRAVALLVRPGAHVTAPAWAPQHTEADTRPGAAPYPDTSAVTEAEADTGGVLSSYVYTRTGRAFFADEEASARFAHGAAVIAEVAGLFDRLDSDWVLLDGEILPWNLKAQGLIDELYRPAAAAGLAETQAVGDALRRAEARGVRVLEREKTPDPTDVASPAASWTREQWEELSAFRAAVERYVDEAGEPQFAVFQVLASAGRTWHEEPHDWHLEVADSLVAAAGRSVSSGLAAHPPATGASATAAGPCTPLFLKTRRVVLDPADATQVEQAVDWWVDLTSSGGEGMVVKPLENSRAGRDPGRVQPGLKVRGKEYLRMIYGPDYDRPERLTGLRSRNLKHKQSLALREYALGLESLDRAVAGEPLHRVHLPVFAVLALESDPVDPRL
ncbi:polynucleotide kinase-phosphatase [Brevibacterium yomogidense]|uniref:polynucleotide kinase-phosphatase n=1 Tax=Brevibacterium yomogidense TaxID=946573 RepID=UPI0018DF1394|nr:polynucleotide kinase-phosphatase [Brevibacterium yomogidense]